MPEVALRTYLREIDSLIDGNQVDEAIAHLKHILTKFPKNIEAYRLLAKALLEKNRHLDAADVFQRVLSTVPDDFVAHAGMAIVRQDEENIEAAIWHMERAYEVQPNNVVIQDALKQLYAQRDGLEPPRLRLSRAALARLYEKGDLYPQAIAEARAALTAEPERIDLKLLLAKSLWRANQKPEAAETAANILRALPYCLEANRIMADIWQETGRTAEAHVFKHRVELLDPYEAHADPAENGTGAMNVPAETIRIERLVYTGQQEISDSGPRPDWMQAIGVEFESPAASAKAAEVPDWLQSIDFASDATVSAPSGESGGDWLSSLRSEGGAPAASPIDSDVNDDLPDWMKEDRTFSSATPPPAEPPAENWLSALGANAPAGKPAPSQLSDSDWLNTANIPAQSATPSVQPADSNELPDWLKGAQPADSQPPPSESGDIASGLPDWMNNAEQPADLSPEAGLPDWLKSAQPPAKISKAAPPPAADSSEAAPDWLKESAANPAPEEPPADELPDWLKDSQATAQPQAAAPVESDDDVPDWLKSAQPKSMSRKMGSPQPSPVAQAAETPDVPEWIRGSTPGTAPEEQPADELPDWMKESQATAQPQWGGQSEPEDVPDWMKEPQSPSEPQTDDAADWLSTPPPVGHQVPVAAMPVLNKAPDDDSPDWMKNVQSDNEEQSIMPASMRSMPPQTPLPDHDNPPDWLKDSQPEDGSVKPYQSQRADSAANIPDWMAAAGWVPRDPTKPLDEPNMFDDKPEADDQSGGEPADIAPAEIPVWLQAHKPTNEPAQPKPSGAAPDWLKQAMEGGSAPPPPEAAAPQSAEEEQPDWLKDITDEQDNALFHEPSEPSPMPAPPADDDVPDWMKNVAGDPSASLAGFLKSKPKETAGLAAAQPPADQVPDWLKELAPEEESEPEAMADVEPVDKLQPPDAELPEWLKDSSVDPGDSVATFLRSKAPAPSQALEDENVPEWLKPVLAETEHMPDPDSVQARPPAEANDLVGASGMPDWMRELSPPEDSRDYTNLQRQTPMPAVEPPAPSPSATSDPGSMSDDEALAWLESLAMKQGAKEEELVSNPEARKSATPEWLRPPSESAADSEEAASAAAPTTGNLPPWLREPADIVEGDVAEEVSDFVPDWMRDNADNKEKESPLTAPPAQVPATESSASATPPVEDMSEDGALAWLESLASKHGAKEEELISRPAERSDAPPEWLKAAAQAQPVEPSESAEDVTETVQWNAPPADEVDDEGETGLVDKDVVAKWLEEQDAKEALEGESAEAQSEAWLAGFKSSADSESEADDSAEEELPSWMQVTPPAESAPPPSDANKKAPWLTLDDEARKELESAKAAHEKPGDVPWLELDDEMLAESDVSQSAQANLPAWLDQADKVEHEPSLAAASEGEVPWLKTDDEESAAILQAAEQTPEWLRDPQGEEEPKTPADAPWLKAETPDDLKILAQAAEELPEWLQQIQSGDSEAPVPPKPAVKAAAPKPAAKSGKSKSGGSKRKRSEPPEVVLGQARERLAETNIGQALELYAGLISKGANLPEVIADLEAANEEMPNTPDLLRALGDAYMKDNQLQRALDTYKRALTQL